MVHRPARRASGQSMSSDIHHEEATKPLPGLVPESVVSLSDAIVLKEAGAFLVCLRDGTVPVAGEHPLGLYLDDCRHLSGHELRVAGVTPRLLVASAASGDEGVHELTNPDVVLDDGRTLPLQTL